jgi:ribose transport system permease protein
MTRLLGVLLLVLVLYATLMGTFEHARTGDNHTVLARQLGFYGVLTLGVGVLIISGGIDLSIGSLVALGAVSFGLLMERHALSPAAAALLVVAGAGCIGLMHGLLVTKLSLQPFLVTLCGLFMYRGLARWIANESSVRLPDNPAVENLRRLLYSGELFGISHQLLLLLLLCGLVAVVLHGSVYGRYLYALGYNEQAARYAGINTDRYKILAYVGCSTLAGLGGVLFLLDVRTAQPTSAGSLLELYAITGAVLGGCSLRGGEGTVLGILLGTAVLPLLKQICNFSDYIGSNLEYTVIGGVLLVGTIADEVI